ncbi:MAG: hypothetical protein V2A56_00340, partial [bacterium]
HCQPSRRFVMARQSPKHAGMLDPLEITALSRWRVSAGDDTLLLLPAMPNRRHGWQSPKSAGILDPLEITAPSRWRVSAGADTLIVIASHPPAGGWRGNLQCFFGRVRA